LQIKKKHPIFVEIIKTNIMKTKICTKKEAFEAAREHFNRKRLRGVDVALMGGNNPYYLFIFKGEAFETR